MDFTQIVALFLVAAGAAFAMSVRRDTRLGTASYAWPRVRGRVVRCFVDDHADGETDEILHSANVEYLYKVGAREYRSRRLAYGDTHGLQFAQAIELLGGLVQDRDVDVFYDPRKPERSVLIQGVVHRR